MWRSHWCHAAMKGVLVGGWREKEGKERDGREEVRDISRSE